MKTEKEWTDEDWLAEFQRMESQRSTPRFEIEIKHISEVPPFTEHDYARMAMALKVRDAKTQKERWDAIRAYYAFAIVDIMEAEPNIPAAGKSLDIYWDDFYTPIERIIANEASYLSIVLYPQFPIGPYFVDFANPKAKVVIECDGAGFHDADKDSIRDAYLSKHGWSVYRFTGSECNLVDRQTNGRPLDEYDPMAVHDEYCPSAAAHRFRHIAVKHGITRRPSIIYDHPYLSNYLDYAPAH